jgi:diguanylate cyclase (GGDEF)-like protein
VSDIISGLDSEEPFLSVVENMLGQLVEYLGVSNASVIQISKDGRSVVTIAERFRGSKDGMSIDESSDCAICGDDWNFCVLSKALGEQKQFLQKYNIKTCVTVPIRINEIEAMYIVVADRECERSFDEEQQAFLQDCAKILQNIAQNKVTKNSLLSSYEVLKEILSSFGSGIMVCEKLNGNVLFQNDVVNQYSDIGRAMNSCIEDFFFRGLSQKMPKMTEYYDAVSGLWFEMKFSDMEWIDGSRVIVCTSVDITQKKKNQQKIEYQAHNDFLTGLYNRMRCESDLRKVIQIAVKQELKGAVLFMDLDNFKHINDGLGHQYGDILLQQVAAALQNIPGLKGHCYRMGGDEFVIIITPELFPIWEKTVKDIIALFNKPWYLMETEYFCTMSMGVSFFPDNGTDVNEVIKLADIAMYEAKKGGKNRYSIYDKMNDGNTIKRLDIENNMRQAIATEIQEFVVFYQPVVDVATKQCTSCEALVRWNSKALGFMGPGEFIPLAEYLGLITSIGDYVLEEACIQCRKWNEIYPDFHINVNLSVVQLLQKDAVKNVASILHKTGVNPKNIVLEITESFAINDMKRVMEIVDGLKKLGPRIALDDFGTGYSSLNYIKQLPLDLIKVDKTFIDDIVEDNYAQAFVKLIVDLSNTIDTKIVVEGVESENQFKLLKNLGVNYIQGFLFGRPVPPEEFERQHLRGKIGGAI